MEPIQASLGPDNREPQTPLRSVTAGMEPTIPRVSLMSAWLAYLALPVTTGTPIGAPPMRLNWAHQSDG